MAKWIVNRLYNTELYRCSRLNTHNFQTPFVWNGQSNVVVEVCFQNGAYTNNAILNQTATPFVSSYWYREDGQGVCANMGSSGSISQRPNMRLRGGYAFTSFF